MIPVISRKNWTSLKKIKNNKKELVMLPYFCENNTCKALIKEKEACEINADNNTDFSKVASNCEIGTLCGTNGTETLKCIKMYSLDEGTKTYNPYLCKSGIIKNNTCSSLSLIVNSCAVDQKCTYEYQAGENKYKETQNCVSSRSGINLPFIRE